MLTIGRVRAAYRRIGLRPASDVYFDEQRNVCCPVVGVLLAEGRLKRDDVKSAMAPAQIADALDVPVLYLCTFVDSLNRWHTTGWARQAAFYEGPLPRDADPALRLMRRGWHDGARVGTALLGPLVQRRRKGVR